MNKYISMLKWSLLGMVISSLVLVACGPAGKSGSQKEQAAAPPAQQAAPAPAAAEGGNLYSLPIKPLTPAECGRCHAYQYKWLQEKGGKHQQPCTNCHEKFHAYNPALKNWDAIMPKCQGCHDLPHGNDFQNCRECHQQPHAPKVIQFASLEKQVPGADKKPVVLCAVCHKAEGTEFAQNPTKHNSEENCQGCHSKVHGTIPSCLDCHDTPHLDTKDVKQCLTCHSPHSALKIKKYPESTPNSVCGGCHEKVYKSLQTNVTKHSALQCATCHVSHGQIPNCRDCHGEPHGAGLHKRFPNCLECHKDPHDLPVNKKK